MFGILAERIHQKFRTLDYPAKEPYLAPLFKGKPKIASCNAKECLLCQNACPTKALTRDTNGKLTLDLGRCTFCAACEAICPEKRIVFTREYRMHAFSRKDLIIREGEGEIEEKEIEEKEKEETIPKLSRIFGRSLKLREVSCGGCGACEADTNVLSTLLYDLGRFGIDFVASPRHADGIVITGPVTANMQNALLDTYNAVPTPRLVVALGTCALSRGLFAESPVCLGIPDEIPVDLFIPGCPPNPWTSLAGLLGLQKRYG